MLSKLHQGHLFFESTTAPFEVADNPSSVQDKARFPTAFLSLARTEILDLSDGSNNAEEHFSKATHCAIMTYPHGSSGYRLQ
jgi:hypothetical protein